MEELVAVKDKIIVAILKKEKTDGGIIIPDNAINEPQAYGVVISVGEEVPEKIKVYNILLFASFGGQDIVYNGEVYKVLSYGEVYCILHNGDIKDFKKFSL